jgi:branched-chain amino acid transport system substrate-binding protein
LRKIAAATIALLILAPGILAGCGGPSEIRIGVIAELTGSIPEVGASCKNAATLAAKQINQAGGITVGGKKYKVELVVRDCDSKPETAASLAEEMTEKDGVVAIVGPNATANAVPAADQAEKQGLVLVTPWSTSPKTTITASGQPKKSVYRVCVTAEYEGNQLAKFARDTLGAKTACVIYDGTAEILKIQAEDFDKSFTALGGSVPVTGTFNPNDKDFSSQLTMIKVASPDVLFVDAYYSNVPAILKQARAMGITAQFLGCDGWSSPTIISESGSAIEGAYVFNMYSPLMKDPLTQAFVKAYGSMYGTQPDDVAALTYDAVNLVKKGFETAGSVDRKALADAMLKVRGFPGVTSNMLFTAASRNPKRGAVMLKVVGGQYTLFQQLKAI